VGVTFVDGPVTTPIAFVVLFMGPALATYLLVRFWRRK
jgi:hypothetical protein